MEASAGRRKVVGKYNLIAEIGHGGMADVFLAVAHGAAGVAKLAVVKEPRPEIAADPELMEMFLDEARLAARLNHPNIVQTYDVGQEGHRYFIAMEYLEGQPLSRIRNKLRHQGGMPLQMQLRVLAEALAGLHYAHELRDYDGKGLGVVHRDVTPQNVFITYAGQTKLVDFGIAKAGSSAVQTKTGVLKGKMSYMSPEQARGDRVDRRTDVFAVGMLLWEAISSKRMWKGLGDLALLAKISHGELVPIREVAPEVPAELERIVGRAMALDPDSRYATAADMQADLEHYLAETGERRSAAAISAFMSETFQDDREAIQAVIDQQLRKVEPRATAEALPRIDPARIAGSPSLSSLTDIDSRPSAPTLRTGGSLTAATAVLGRPAPAAPKKSAVLAAAAVIGAAAAGTVFFVTSRGPRHDVAPEVAASAPVPATPEVAATVDLVVEVSPDNARVLLDDALLSTGRYAGKLPREPRVYKLRVEAPGFTSRVELITPTADVKLIVALEKTAAAAASAPAPASDGGPVKRGAVAARPSPEPAAEPIAAPAATAAPAEDPLRRHNAPKPTRQLDSENPYAR